MDSGGGSSGLTFRNTWLIHSGISVDRFKDAVNSRVSVPYAGRLTGGLGIEAETAYVWDGHNVGAALESDSREYSGFLNFEIRF